MFSKMFLPMILSLLIFLQRVAVALDLETDKQTVLDLTVSHGLGWKPADPICSSWTGVSCNSDRNRVSGLRLSGLGLCGPILKNTTIGRLDALETLHLENNFLTGPILPGLDLLPRLKSLNLSNNGFSGPITPSLLKRFPPSSFRGNPLLATSGLPQRAVSIPRLLSSSLSKGSRDSKNKRSEPVGNDKFPWVAYPLVLLVAVVYLGGLL